MLNALESAANDCKNVSQNPVSGEFVTLLYYNWSVINTCRIEFSRDLSSFKLTEHCFQACCWHFVFCFVISSSPCVFVDRRIFQTHRRKLEEASVKIEALKDKLRYDCVSGVVVDSLNNIAGGSYRYQPTYYDFITLVFECRFGNLSRNV